MPITKRPRAAPKPSGDGVNKRTTRSQTDIQSFARVSKPAASPASSKKRKAVTQEDAEKDTEPAKLVSCKKLRRPRASQRPISETPTDTPTKGTSTLLADLELSTPTKPGKLKLVPESPSPVDETPLTSPCSSSAPSSKGEKKSADDLPQGIHDLITLHSSFLTALSLHYAHNGTASPVDLRALTPSVTKSWGKRKVTIDDIRRTLGVMQSSLSTNRPAAALKSRTFHLSDYGRGKICLEQHENKKHRAKRSNSVIPKHIDETALNALFASELNTRWTEYRCKITPNSKSPSSVSFFISQLPQAEITECASLAKVAPLFAKGQRRLEDLKAGAIKAQASNSCFTTPDNPTEPASDHARPASVKTVSTKASFSTHKKSASSTTSITTTSTTSSDDAKSTKTSSSSTPLVPATAAAPSRATSLLDRILAKQAAAASTPAGPTPEARARQAALQRCEEVLATLSLLATTASPSSSFSSTPVPVSTRVSFPLPRLVRDIQGSSRSPLSVDEVRKIVEVLAREIVPGWVGLVQMGTLEAVVVDRGRTVGGQEVRRRVVAAGVQV